MASRAQEPDRLILVDDDVDVLGAMRFAFEAYGYLVTTYGSGEALLADPPSEQPACIVIDFRLPGVSGIDAVLQLRERGVCAPTILITSHPSSAVKKRAAAAAIEIVEKPLLGDALVRRVRAAFEASRPDA